MPSVDELLVLYSAKKYVNDFDESLVRWSSTGSGAVQGIAVVEYISEGYLATDHESKADPFYVRPIMSFEY